MTNPSIRLDLTPRGTIERLDWLAWFTDSAVPIPGTGRTMGADSVLSLVPGMGSLMGAGLSTYVLAEALRHGAPPRILGRMGLNIAADAVIGAVPVAGFFFDMFFKANQRNVSILRDYMKELNR
ncbi:DUF4112 domain-containing protein [Aestuariivirga sp.]|jgi:hypothetical protein|uniref:DUF4112 domain-containing protein n=1 Tax=Aestuariivirga sp. TaxID=2650926 RepID=UPI003784E631